MQRRLKFAWMEGSDFGVLGAHRPSKNDRSGLKYTELVQRIRGAQRDQITIVTFRLMVFDRSIWY
jgi:hypothetical protein